MTTMVKVEHIRAARLCTRGARDWFRKYNLSWAEFVKHGLPVETIEATGDALGLRVAAIARERAET